MGGVPRFARIDLEPRMNRLLDYTPDMEFLNEEMAPAGTPRAHQAHQHTAMTFGAALLEVGSAAELEYFLTDLVMSLAAKTRTPIAAPLGKALVDVLKRAARAILPIHGSGAGAPGFGTDGGADLKARAARIFGMELEGLSPEDKEFEVAQQFVRLAFDTIGNAALAPGAGEPRAAAGAALQQAARRFAPGLLQVEAQMPAQAQQQGGRWQRQGRRIVVLNC